MAWTRRRILGASRAFRRVLALGLVVSLLGGCAHRGNLVGRVRTPPERTKDVVVMAWREDGSPPPTPVERARVVHLKGRFEPRVLVVEAGTTVEFENKDKIFHKVFSVSPKAKFTLGAYRPGEIRAATAFTDPGVVQVWCELHSRESLYVVVVPDRWHMRPAANGAFAFDRMPHGRYMLRAWHPSLGQVTRRVDVPSDRPTVLSFDR